MSRLGMVVYHGIESGAELAEYGRIAEDTGFDSLWVTERYFHEETFSLLGYLAAVTQTLKLGVGVVNPYTRNPALLAMAAATLDRLSGGRLVLGLGRSEPAVIQDKMGIRYGKAGAAMEGAVGLLNRLLSGQRVTATAGPFKFSNTKLSPAPIRKTPIYLAAIGRKGLRLAGAIADGVVLNAYVPTSYVSYAVEEIRNAARAAGRDPAAIDISCMLVVRLNDDPHRLYPTLRKRLVRLLDEAFVGEILLEKGGFDPGILAPLRAAYRNGDEDTAAKLVSDDMVNAFYVIGPADTCKARIAAYRAAGVDAPLLLPRLEDYRKVAEALRD